MHKVLIEDIENAPNGILKYNFNDYIDELKCNISADLFFKNIGEFIEVTGSANGKMKLVCDRCLDEYDYDLDINIKETFAKQALYDEYSQEVELSSGQFVTDLNGEDNIDIYDLLYQSVILSLPNKKVCGINCKGSEFIKNETFVQDDRMSIFKNIEIKNKN